MILKRRKATQGKTKILTEFGKKQRLQRFLIVVFYFVSSYYNL